MPPEQVYQNLIQSGYPPEVAKMALQLEQQGYTPEQIDQVLQQQMQGATA